jgi:hypothetical protein
METIHKKTGDIYVVIETDVINATNGREHERMIIYRKKGNTLKTFVRESKEFFEKFDVEDSEIISYLAQSELDMYRSGTDKDWKRPLIDRVKYDLRRYTELAKRMDELMHECNLEADYSGAKEAKIKRNCYNKFVNDLKQLVV